MAFRFRSFTLGNISLSIEFLPRKVDRSTVRLVKGEVTIELLNIIVTIAKLVKPKMSWH